jgi:hypothetical protein
MITNRTFFFLFNDPRLLEFLVYYENTKKQIDTLRIEVELEQKLTKRIELKSVSLLDDVDYSSLRTMIINNSIESQLLRSRLCHMRIEIFSKLKRLSERQDALKKYLFIEYRPQLEAQGMKTQADKNYIIDTCFIECAQFITELETLQEAIVFFIEDLDKNLWTLKNLVDVLELTFKNKVGI